MTQWRKANPEKALVLRLRSEAKHKQSMSDCSNRIHARTKARRKEMLSVFPCVCCGEPDNTVIQWHHVDPSEKEIRIWSAAWPEEKFWDEVLKCVPVCANCHLKIHKNKLCLIPPKLR